MSTPYTSDSPLRVRQYQFRARVGSLSPSVPEAADVPDSPPAYDRLSKRRLTICVVGSGGVGKSSLTVRYLNNHFPEVSWLSLLDNGRGSIVINLFSLS